MINTVSDYFNNHYDKDNEKWEISVQIGDHTVSAVDLSSSDIEIKYGSLSGAFRVGVADAVTARFELMNHDGRWDNVDLSDLNVDITINLLEGETKHPLKMASNLVITELNYVDAILTVECADKMIIAEQRTLDESGLAIIFPIKMQLLIQKLCAALGVIPPVNGWRGSEYELLAPEDDKALSSITFRDVFAFAGFLAGGAAFLNRSGSLEIVTYPSAGLSETDHPSDLLVKDDNTFTLTLSRGETLITGLRYNAGENTLLLGDDSGSVFDVPANPLLYGDEDKITEAMGLAWLGLNGLRTYPFEARVLHNPLIEPYKDIARIQSRIRGTSELHHDVRALVTGCVYRFWKSSTVGCAGEHKNVASIKGPTEKALATLNEKQKEAQRKLTNVAQWQEEMALMAARKSGFYFTYETQPDGSVIRYEHDQPNLADSLKIWKYTSDASLHSPDGGLTWYGQDVAGNQLQNIIKATEIDATKVFVSEGGDVEQALALLTQHSLILEHSLLHPGKNLIENASFGHPDEPSVDKWGATMGNLHGKLELAMFSDIPLAVKMGEYNVLDF